MDQTSIKLDYKISDLITNNLYLLLLLEHFGIDMPLQDKSIQTICTENNLNTNLFLTFANLYNNIQYKPIDILTFNDAHAIINFLKNSHKFYSEEIYPNILNTIQELVEVNNYKEITLVQKFFINYFNEVSEHLEYENKVVFPYVLDLYEQIKKLKHIDRKTSYSVNEYRDHHNDIEEKLNDLKSLLIKYLPQKNDHAIRRKLLFSLSELEYDLNIHSKIEDLILIPLVTKMEFQINKSK